MRLSYLLLGYLTALLVTIPTHALHEPEVGIVDWHKSLIGVPLSRSLSTAPVFHRVNVGKETNSVVITATESNVLAALDPVNGSVSWRHIFEEKDPIVVFKKNQDIVAALSGPGGSMLRTFDALRGHLILEKQLHTPKTGMLFEPNDLGVSIAFVPNSDQLLVLTNGHTLRSIDGTTGEIKWSWTSEDQSSLIMYSKIVITPSTSYLLGLAKSVKSFTLHATTLSTQSGTLVASQNVPSSLSSVSPTALPSNAFLTLHIPTTMIPPHVFWLESNSLRSFALNPELTGKPGGFKGVMYKELVDIGLAEEHGIFVAVLADGSGKVVKLSGEKEGGVRGLLDFAESADSSKYTSSVYAGGLDKDGYPYVSRVYWSHVLQKASIHTFAPHLSDGKGLLTGITIPFDTNTHGIISHAAIDTANPSEFNVLTRAMLTTTTGAVQLWQQDKEQWTREEALANIAVAEFVELPEMKVIQSLGGENESFVRRIMRQVLDAKDFPRYLTKFIKRFATGSYESVSTSASASSSGNTTATLSRDAFGFRQVIVAASQHNKIYGLDSSNGHILWSRVLGLGWAGEIGGSVLPVKLYITRSVGDTDEDGQIGTPQVVLVTQRRAENTLVDTVIFHIDAMTGEDARKISPSGDIFQGLDIISGPIIQTFLLQNKTKTVLLLDEFMQVYLYPDTTEHKADFEAAVPFLYFPVRTGGPGKRQLMGHQPILNPELSTRYVGHPVWTFSLPPNEEIQSIIPSKRGPVASIGKVLGNRSTLYKYLNPHLTALLTSSPKSESHPPTCAIYLVDAVKGSLVYHVTLPSSAGVCDVKATITENWLVYSYFDEDFAGVGQSKGYRVVSVELYEGIKADDKVKSSDMSSFSNRTTAVTSYEQSYVAPYGIAALTTTSTKFGVSVKDIIFASKDSKIQSLPRRFLDPRRPDRKLTSEEVEEQLVQYEPVLQNQPQRVLSHNYKVSNVRRIVTAPALLESTSLVFAYGLDLFLTRVSPSSTFDVLSENFNKAQLVLTIVALVVAIVVTKPMVKRKRLRERWYQ